MNAELNKQTLEKLKLAKEDAIQKNLKFEFDDLIEMFEERVKKDKEDEENYKKNFTLINNKDYAHKFFDSFYNQKEKNLKDAIPRFLDDVFDVDKPFSKSDLDILTEMYKLLEKNIELEKA
jgi:hypothetical protein